MISDEQLIRIARKYGIAVYANNIVGITQLRNFISEVSNFNVKSTWDTHNEVDRQDGAFTQYEIDEVNANKW